MSADANPPTFSTDRFDPNLTAYHELIAQFLERDGRELVLTVAPEVVSEGEVGMFTMILMAAQHYPEALDRLIFGIRYEFEREEDSEDLLPEPEWKADATVQQWLFRHTQFVPWAVYFLQDHDCRCHALFGDLLQSERDQMEIVASADGRHDRINFTESQTQTLFERILQASVLLLHFCRPAGIVPQMAIEALLAEFDVTEHTDWDFNRVYERFEQEVAEGFRMRAVAPDDEEEEEEDEE